MLLSVVRTALLAIIGFMPSEGGGAIGSLDYTAEERKILAKRSLHFITPPYNFIYQPSVVTDSINVASPLVTPSKPHKDIVAFALLT